MFAPQKERLYRIFDDYRKLTTIIIQESYASVWLDESTDLSGDITILSEIEANQWLLGDPSQLQGPQESRVYKPP